MPAVSPQPLVLQKLVLTNFKNHAAATYSFHPYLTCITGLNGIGKTNLLDAIYLLALTKSRFQKSDADLIAQGADFYRVAADFLVNENQVQVSVAYSLAEGKVLKTDSKQLPRLADHIGQLPVVFINPDDTTLVRGGAEERRKFFDNLLGQSSPVYLQALMAQNRLLQQRNALLAQMAERGSRQLDVLEAIDGPLLTAFTTVATQRAACLQALLPAFASYYEALSLGREVPAIQYVSQVIEPNFTQLFYQNQRQDMASQRTLLGAHRDEFDLLMNGQPARKVGSQGQQKTFLLALKLAMHHYLTVHTGRKPMLLLDDIFERLDETRMGGLLHLLGQGQLGQVFITEATGSRMQRIVQKAGLGDSGFIDLVVEK